MFPEIISSPATVPDLTGTGERHVKPVLPLVTA